MNIVDNVNFCTVERGIILGLAKTDVFIVDAVRLYLSGRITWECAMMRELYHLSLYNAKVVEELAKLQEAEGK